MILLNQINTKETFKKAKKLYKKAFPKEEQKPFKFLIKNQQKGVYDLLSVEDDESIFYGLAFLVKKDNLVLLDFLAISDEFRNQGIGSKVLKLLQEKYGDKKLFLEIENTTSNNAPNILQRIKRKEFYLKNSMTAQPYKVLLFGCDMEILSFEKPVSFEEYFSIFVKLYGNKKAEKKIKLFQE